MVCYYVILISCIVSTATTIPMPNLQCKSEGVEVSFNVNSFNLSGNQWALYFGNYHQNDTNCMKNVNGSHYTRTISIKSAYDNCGIWFSFYSTWYDSPTNVYHGNVYLREVTNSVIARNVYQFTFRCYMNMTTNTTFRGYSYIGGTKYIEGASVFKPKFALYTDQSFTQQKYPSVRLGEKMYFQISITKHSTNAEINAASCYASDINGKNRHYLINNSCPSASDGTVELLTNNTDPHAIRWKNDAFMFKGSNNYFYVTCELWVCYKNAWRNPLQCQRCTTRRNRRQVSDDQKSSDPVEATINSPLIKILPNENNAEEKSNTKTDSIFGKNRDTMIIGLLVAVVFIVIVVVIVHVKLQKSRKVLPDVHVQNIGIDNKGKDTV